MSVACREFVTDKFASMAELKRKLYASHNWQSQAVSKFRRKGQDFYPVIITSIHSIFP